MSDTNRLVRIIETLCDDVADASPSQIKKSIMWAIGEVRSMGYDIDSVFDKSEGKDERETKIPATIDVGLLPESLRKKFGVVR